jgi:hypothetical protein
MQAVQVAGQSTQGAAAAESTLVNLPAGQAQTPLLRVEGAVQPVQTVCELHLVH